MARICRVSGCRSDCKNQHNHDDKLAFAHTDFLEIDEVILAGKLQDEMGDVYASAAYRNVDTGCGE